MSSNNRTPLSARRLREELVGLSVEVPVLSGGMRRYVNLDNASSTPPFRPVLDKVEEFLEFYSNVHRGTGFKSQLASAAIDESRRIVARFVKADPEHDTVIFTKNTTESLNKLARLYPFRPGNLILTTLMEHSSNELPWRRAARVEHIGVRPDGSLDMEDCASKLKQYAGRVDLVCVAGAANVTGWVNPVNRLAAMAHEAGAKIAVDAAQSAAHRPIDMKPHGDPEHIDFLAFSAHKIYAPFGVGVLAGDRASLARGEPELVGGGTVDLVTEQEVLWRGLPAREEAGTPDTVGVVALAATLRLLEAVGWEQIVAHEDELARYMLERMAGIPGVRIVGKADATDVSDRLGVVAFNVGDLSHGLVAAILSYEGAVGVRNGCFCAHQYVLRMLGVGAREAARLADELRGRDRTNVPGTVRASIGVYNDRSDIDALSDCLAMVSEGRYEGRYRFCRETGAYAPEGVSCFDTGRFFSLDPRLV